jgi:hypothetical protein
LANIINHAKYAPPEAHGRHPAKFPLLRREMTMEEMANILARARSLGWKSRYKVEEHARRRKKQKNNHAANSNKVHFQHTTSNTDSINTESSPYNHITFGANNFEEKLLAFRRLENDIAQMQKDYTNYVMKYKLENQERPYNPVDPEPLWPKAREAFKWATWYIKGLRSRQIGLFKIGNYVYSHPDGAATQHVSEIRSGFNVAGRVSSRYYTLADVDPIAVIYPRMAVIIEYFRGREIFIKITFEFRKSELIIYKVKVFRYTTHDLNPQNTYTSTEAPKLFHRRVFETFKPSQGINHLLSSLGAKVITKRLSPENPSSHPWSSNSN